MLTQRHLALIRAALQFFDDEMVPHGRKAIRPYLDAPLGDNVTSAEIQKLRSFLRNVELKFGRFDRRTARMIETQLNDLITPVTGGSEMCVTVLVPRSG